MKARRSDPLSTSRRRRVLAFGAPSIASLVRARTPRPLLFSPCSTPRLASPSFPPFFFFLRFLDFFF
jgi:hypothetical protein